MWSYNYTDPDILEHYGILGMKWGVRRFQDKKGRLTSAGKKRYSEESSNGSSKEVGDSFIERKLGVKFSDRTKTAIKVGAGIAAAALVAYGGYRLYNSDAGKPLRDYIDGLIGKHLESEDRLEFKHTGKLTEHAKKDLSTAYELRRRGYDVRANFAEQGRSVKTLSDFFKNAEIQDDSALANRTKSEWMSAIERRLLRQGDGARGNFGGQYAMGGGHSIIYEVANGKVIFRDGQTGQTYRNTYDAIGRFVPGKSNYFRMDNLEINNDTIHNAVSTFGLPRVNTNVMETDPVQANNYRKMVLEFRRNYKKNTGYDIPLQDVRKAMYRHYGVKV